MNLTFAKLYHAQHKEYQEDIPFWLALADEAGGPTVELGCGTGRITSPLIERGYKVTGVDNDPEMLEFIRANFGQRKNLKLVNADFIKYSDYQDVGLVILPCNTYSTFNVEDRFSLLKNIYENIPVGAVFYTSIINPDLIKDMPDCEEPELETTIEHPETGCPLLISAEWKTEAGKFLLTWHYDHLLPDGQVQRASRTTEHFQVLSDVYLQEFVEAGFDVELIGDFDGGAFNDESQYLIIKAKK